MLERHVHRVVVTNHGQVTGIVSSLDLLRASERLAGPRLSREGVKSLESACAFFDHMADGIGVADASGELLYMNQAAANLLDVAREERRARSACDLICKDLRLAAGRDAKHDCPLRAPGRGDSVTFEGRRDRLAYNWRDDQVWRRDVSRDLRVRCVRVRLPLPGVKDEDLHLILIEDDSAQAELKRHREDWRGMIAHDLREPLSAVYAALTLLEELHPKVRTGAANSESKMVATSLRSCRRMMELLDLSMDVAQLDAGGWPTKLETVDVAKLAEEVAGAAAPRAQEAGVSVAVEIPQSSAVADAELLRRVFVNLLDNAVKYNVKGGSVKLAAASENGLIRVTFADTGKGIDADALPFIFDRYYQAQARREGRIRGNGLGLTFAREALKAMGGSISAESDPGKGSVFTVLLKAAA
jgi:signal transduction histidine kinase